MKDYRSAEKMHNHPRSLFYVTSILLVEIITSGSLRLSHGLLKSVEVG
jgi:hypothetical protein